MLSSELKKRAEDHLAHVNKEIATFVPSDHGPSGEDYLKQLKAHQELWRKFLSR